MLASATPQRKIYNTIQILRGVAALIVVVFHLTLVHAKEGGIFLAGSIFQNGFAGVDLFFVISGFVIMHTSHRYFSTPSYFSVYLRKRLVRIYPVYWVTLLCIIGGLLLLHFTVGMPVKYVPQTWDSFLSMLLLLPGHMSPNGVTWSLTYELYYYLLFGLLILSQKLWLLVGLVLIVSGVGVLNPNLFPPDVALFKYCFSPYNLEFASGVLAWWLLNRFNISSVLSLLTLAGSGVWLLIQDSVLNEQPAKRVMLYGVSFFLLVLASTSLERNGWLRPSLFTRLLIRIGDASYLIYIIHFPFLHFYGKLIESFASVEINPVEQHSIALAFATLLTAVCIYLHIHFEVPLVKRLNLLLNTIRTNPVSGQ